MPKLDAGGNRFQVAHLVLHLPLILLLHRVGDDLPTDDRLDEVDVEPRATGHVRAEDRVLCGCELTLEGFLVLRFRPRLAGAEEEQRKVGLDLPAVDCGRAGYEAEFQIPVEPSLGFVDVERRLDNLHKVVGFRKKWDCGVNSSRFDGDVEWIVKHVVFGFCARLRRASGEPRLSKVVVSRHAVDKSTFHCEAVTGNAAYMFSGEPFFSHLVCLVVLVDAEGRKEYYVV